MNRRATVAGFALLLLGGMAAAETADSPSLTNDAKNLARYNCGARITWISPDRSASWTAKNRDSSAALDLLLDDTTLSHNLAAGRHALIVALSDISNLSRFVLVNEKARLAGTMQLFVSNTRLSANDSKWIAAGQQVRLGHQRFVSLPLSATEAKYVRIVFNVEKPGTIAGLGLYGQRSLESFSVRQPQAADEGVTTAESSKDPTIDNLNFNFANRYARARVLAVSSGSPALADRMIDDDATTQFQFAPNDKLPTVILELGLRQRLCRIGMVYAMEPGSLEVYLLNQRPEIGNLEQARPLMTVKDENGDGKITAEFSPHGARYVALRWVPNGNSNSRFQFSIADIGAFSDVVSPVLESAAIPQQFAHSAIVTGLPPAPPIMVAASP
ncbi:MAG TPA: hypothetical protein VJ719_07370 [Chthoniobacterales bacterium]|nr:hypothetical protein [Chthoniobacterales bacterium]